MSSLAVILQKIFFANVKKSPNPIWQKRARKLGNYQQFDILRNGKKIACYRIDPDPGCLLQSDSIVIFSHPISPKGKFFFSDSERARAYLARGFSVLAFDYNGFGESDPIDLFYWRDVAAVIEHAKTQNPTKKIVLHGTSFGAFHIIRALDYLPSGAKVVLENVNKSLLSYWQKWPNTGRLVRLLNFLRFRSIREMDVQHYVQNFRRPDLHIQFLACDQDVYTTPDEMRELYDLLATPNKSFTLFEGAGHLAAPAKHPELYLSVLFERGCAPC